MNRRHFIASSTLSIPMVALGSIIPSEPVVDANFIVDNIISKILYKKYPDITVDFVCRFEKTNIPRTLNCVVTAPVTYVVTAIFGKSATVFGEPVSSIDEIRKTLINVEKNQKNGQWYKIEGRYNFLGGPIDRIYLHDKIPHQWSSSVGVRQEYTLKEWLKLNA